MADFNEEDLTPEGLEMWRMIQASNGNADFVVEMMEEKTARKTRRTRPMTVAPVVEPQPEVQRMRIELRRLQQNSRIVVKECEDMMKVFLEKEQYFKLNEARVAKTIHTNLIERLDRILNGGSAFDHVDHLDQSTIFVR